MDEDPRRKIEAEIAEEERLEREASARRLQRLRALQRRERHVRLESERIARSVGVDPLEAAAALTAASPEFAAAELIVGCEMMLEEAALDEAAGGGRR